MIVPTAVGQLVLADALSLQHARYADLEARGLLRGEGPQEGLATIAKRTRKAFLRQGPSLRIFIVTLRCDHSCQYCQVSRASLAARGKDMSLSDARAAVDRVMESDAPAMTIEFQGGEPSLRFDLVRDVVIEVERRIADALRSVRFTMATTLHLLTAADR